MARIGTRARRQAVALMAAAAAAAVALVALAPGLGSAQSASVPISQLTLSGANEVPAVTTTAVGYFSGSATATSLSFDLSADSSEKLTMAHIHIGAVGTNGPIVAFLFGPNADGVKAFHVTGTIAQANLVGPLAGNWQGFADALAKGELYVNVHSTDNPGGEVRVWIPATKAPTLATPAPPKTGTGAAGGDGGSAPAVILGGMLVLVAAAGAVYAVARRRA